MNERFIGDNHPGQGYGGISGGAQINTTQAVPIPDRACPTVYQLVETLRGEINKKDDELVELRGALVRANDELDRIAKMSIEVTQEYSPNKIAYANSPKYR